VDIAEAPDAVAKADIVVLHRVVCCYPDYERLLSAAGNHAERLLVFSHPKDNAFFRGLFRAQNLACRIRRQSFRAFVHPAAAMEQVLAGTGLTTRDVHQGKAWRVVGLER
jgi:magnesium-protoporphyrin O-methyltransferase